MARDDRFPYSQAEMWQEETLHGVCVRMVRVIDRGKSPPTPFRNVATGRGTNLPVYLRKGQDWLGKLDASGTHRILVQDV